MCKWVRLGRVKVYKLLIKLSTERKQLSVWSDANHDFFSEIFTQRKNAMIFGFFDFCTQGKKPVLDLVRRKSWFFHTKKECNDFCTQRKKPVLDLRSDANHDFFSQRKNAMIFTNHDFFTQRKKAMKAMIFSHKESYEGNDFCTQRKKAMKAMIFAHKERKLWRQWF